MIYSGTIDIYNGECGSLIPIDEIRVCFKKSDADFELYEGMELKFDCDDFGSMANGKKKEIVWVNKLGEI